MKRGTKETLALVREYLPEEPLLGRNVTIKTLQELLIEKGIKRSEGAPVQTIQVERADYHILDRLVRQGDSGLFAFLQELKNKTLSREETIKLLRVAVQVPRAENMALVLWDRVDKNLLSEKIFVLAVKGKSLRVIKALLDYFESPPLDEALLAVMRLKKVPESLVKLLLERGADPSNLEVLQLAIQTNSSQLVGDLLADVEDPDLLRKARAFVNDDQEEIQDLFDEKLP